MREILVELDKSIKDAIEISRGNRERHLAIGLLEKTTKRLESLEELNEEERTAKRDLLFQGFKSLGLLHDSLDQDMEAIRAFETALRYGHSVDIREKRAFLMGMHHDDNYLAAYHKVIGDKKCTHEHKCHFIFVLELNGEHAKALKCFEDMIKGGLTEEVERDIIILLDNLIERYSQIPLGHAAEYRNRLLRRHPDLQQRALVPSGIRDVAEHRETAPDVGLAQVAKAATKFGLGYASRRPFHTFFVVFSVVLFFFPFVVVRVGERYLSVLNFYYGFGGASLCVCYWIVSDQHKRLLVELFWILALSHFATYLLLLLAVGITFQEIIWWPVLLVYVVAFYITHYNFIMRSISQIKDATQKAIINRRRIYAYFSERARFIVIFLIYIWIFRFLVTYFQVPALARLAMMFEILYLACAYYYSTFAMIFRYRKMREELMILMVLLYLGIYATYHFAGLNPGEIVTRTILETIVLVLLIYCKKFILETKVSIPRYAGVVGLLLVSFNFITLLTTYDFASRIVTTIMRYYDSSVALLNVGVAIVSAIVSILAYRALRRESDNIDVS